MVENSCPKKNNNKIMRLWEHLIKSWFWRSILFPFITTRTIWFVVGLFSLNFVSNPTYAQYAERGWFLSPHFLIDLFSRWDAKWYLSIVEIGYQAPEVVSETISNIAFFPLFPYLIKIISWILPDYLLSRSVYLLIGLIISNASFLVAVYFLFGWIKEEFESEEIAHRTLQLIFIFPTSFFFSAFYTESLFLLLAILSLFSAWRKRWVLSSIFCGLLALTRPQGILMVIPLAVIYFETIGFRLRKIRWNIVYFGFPFFMIAGYLYLLSTLTGDILAPFEVQKAWGRMSGSILESLWHQIGAPVFDVFKLDALFLVIILGTSLFIFFKFSSKAFGLYSFLVVLMPLLSGSVISMSRYVLVAFPVFIFWAKILKNKEGFDAVRGVLFAIQILYFLGWANYYWIA